MKVVIETLQAKLIEIRSTLRENAQLAEELKRDLEEAAVRRLEYQSAIDDIEKTLRTIGVDD